MEKKKEKKTWRLIRRKAPPHPFLSRFFAMPDLHKVAMLFLRAKSKATHDLRWCGPAKVSKWNVSAQFFYLYIFYMPILQNEIQSYIFLNSCWESKLSKYSIVNNFKSLVISIYWHVRLKFKAVFLISESKFCYFSNVMVIF